MKTKFLVILMMFVFVVNISPINAAKDSPTYKVYLGPQYGTYGQVMFWYGDSYQVIGMNLQPNEKYTLLYIENPIKPVICSRYDNGCQIRPGQNSYSSTLYPKVKCITNSILSDEEGNVNNQGRFSYLKITEDNKKQRLYLVPSKDVRCNSGRMSKWNIDSYIFDDVGI